MSEDYKDFSNYNSASRSIRPSARIQLIQRILNAANLISNMGSGLPLKWASNYKSFQVLKYTENSDPEDVTSPNAVTAVDSLLFETENQLRAAQDDMNTLTSELENMDLVGQAYVRDIVAMELDHPDTTRNVYITQFGYNNDNYVLYMKVDSNGSLVPYKVYLARLDHWESLTNRVGDDAWAYKNRNTVGNNSITTGFVCMKLTNGSPIINVSVFINHGSNPDLQQIVVRMNISEVVISNGSKQAMLSDFTLLPTGDNEYTLNCTDDRSMINGGILPQGSVEMHGWVEASDALGLPDPTEVINQIVNLE